MLFRSPKEQVIPAERSGTSLTFTSSCTHRGGHTRPHITAHTHWKHSQCADNIFLAYMYLLIKLLNMLQGLSWSPATCSSYSWKHENYFNMQMMLGSDFLEGNWKNGLLTNSICCFLCLFSSLEHKHEIQTHTDTDTHTHTPDTPTQAFEVILWRVVTQRVERSRALSSSAYK